MMFLIINPKTERLLWSIALPGFGQILNGDVFKGLIFFILEVLINVKARLNLAIISSFTGETELAASQTDYQWLMFYPCIYLFAIWEAYREKGRVNAVECIPFVSAAYIGTLGVIYSRGLRVFGLFPGPVWLPIIAMLAGFILGLLVKRTAKFTN